MGLPRNGCDPHDIASTPTQTPAMAALVAMMTGSRERRASRAAPTGIPISSTVTRSVPGMPISWSIVAKKFSE